MGKFWLVTITTSIAIMLLSVVTLIWSGNHRVPVKSYIQQIAVARPEKIAVFAIKLSPKKNIPLSIQAILNGDMLVFLLPQDKAAKNYTLFNDLSYLKIHPGDDIITIDITDPLFQKLEIAKLIPATNKFVSQRISVDGIRALNFYAATAKQVTTDKKEIGVAIMASGSRYPIYSFWVEPNELGIS